VVGAGLACLSNASNTPAQSEAKVFTRADVAKHDNPKDGIWVMYKYGVYDITGERNYQQ
jgi:cytochrome b involved in lipid metabolism